MLFLQKRIEADVSADLTRFSESESPTQWFLCQVSPSLPEVSSSIKRRFDDWTILEDIKKGRRRVDQI
ncbi:hypothetical protein HN011_000998, partial [Eciton burchellii]